MKEKNKCCGPLNECEVSQTVWLNEFNKYLIKQICRYYPWKLYVLFMSCLLQWEMNWKNFQKNMNLSLLLDAIWNQSNKAVCETNLTLQFTQLLNHKWHFPHLHVILHWPAYNCKAVWFIIIIFFPLLNTVEIWQHLICGWTAPLMILSCAEMKHVDVKAPSSPADWRSLQNSTRLLTEIKLLF